MSELSPKGLYIDQKLGPPLKKTMYLFEPWFLKPVITGQNFWFVPVWACSGSKPCKKPNGTQTSSDALEWSKRRKREEERRGGKEQERRRGAKASSAPQLPLRCSERRRRAKASSLSDIARLSLHLRRCSFLIKSNYRLVHQLLLFLIINIGTLLRKVLKCIFLIKIVPCLCIYIYSCICMHINGTRSIRILHLHWAPV